MSALHEKELLLLAALDHYRTWHTCGFLAGKGLIPPDWPPRQVRQVACGLADQGLAEPRWSASRRQWMYRITPEGSWLLGPGRDDRLAQAGEGMPHDQSARTDDPTRRDAQDEPPGSRLVRVAASR